MQYIHHQRHEPTINIIVIYIIHSKLFTGPVKGLSNTLPLNFNSALSGQREPCN